MGLIPLREGPLRMFFAHGIEMAGQPDARTWLRIFTLKFDGETETRKKNAFGRRHR
jgi:hypothetical protein